ncbi:MAG: hypothetical protein QGH39_05575 [Candidatus Thermoplasmatota archaeon]|nr:hypothetical protein [Candidatus Thermoplasmatota archaeon]
MHQTDKDPRIAVAELALRKLKNNIFSKSKFKIPLSRNQTNELLSNIESQIMVLKFSYMEPVDLASSDITAGIIENVKKLYLVYRERMERDMSDMARANLLWSFRVFSGLPRRFKIKREEPTSGIDIVAVQVRNIAKIGKLYRTRCSAGPADMTIMTNIEGLKAGDTLAAAFLPPAVVGGVVSEAMFLGAERLETEPGAFLDYSIRDTKEADGILVGEFGKRK